MCPPTLGAYVLGDALLRIAPQPWRADSCGSRTRIKMKPWAGKQMQGHERTGREKETWQELISGILAGGNPVEKAFPGQVSEAMGFQIPHVPTAQLQASKYAPSTYWGPALCYVPGGKCHFCKEFIL